MLLLAHVVAGTCCCSTISSPFFQTSNPDSPKPAGKVKLRFKLTKKLPGQAIAPGSGGGNASGAGTHSEDAAGSEPASKRTRQ
jgi:hypothetical protein